MAIGRWLGTGIVSESTLHASSGFLRRKPGSVDGGSTATTAPYERIPGQTRRCRTSSTQASDPLLDLVGFGLVVAAYAITVMGLIDHGMWRDSVARFGFMAALLAVAWTAHLALRPTGGFLEPLIAKFAGSVIHRIRFVIYLAGLGFPLSMVALSAFGYGFTANELIIRAIITLVSLLIAATLWATFEDSVRSCLADVDGTAATTTPI